MARKKGFVDGIARARNGSWKLRIVVRGRLIKRTFKTKEEAERVRDNLQGRAKLASLGVPLAQTAALVAPTIGSVLDGYARECETLGRSEAHLRSIREARAYFVAWGGEHREADALRRADLVDFIGFTKKTTESKGRVIHNAIVKLRTALKLAELPVPPEPPLELPARVPKTLKQADVKKLLGALPLGSVARTALEIGLRTSARGSEILRLRVGDVDLERRTLTLTRMKGKKGRRGSEEAVPIPDVLVRVLRAYTMRLPADLAPDAPLLAVESRRRGVGKGRHALHVGSLRRALAKACEDAGVPKKTTIGWCRAEAVTLAREAGATLKKTAAAAGHEDPRITAKHYDESGAAAAEKWAAREELGAEMDNLLPFAAEERAAR